jgi:ribosomal protein S18 acetylase RimI-like enzyme
MRKDRFDLSVKNVRDAKTLRDAAELQKLDAACFEFPWPESSFIQVLSRAASVVISLVFDGASLIAYIAYDRKPRQRNAQVLRIAVLSEFRRRGIGSQLLQRLRNELAVSTGLACHTPDTDLVGQLFLKANNFIATETKPDYYAYATGLKADGYLFVHGATPPTIRPRVLPRQGQLTTTLHNRFGGRPGFGKPTAPEKNPYARDDDDEDDDDDDDDDDDACV